MQQVDVTISVTGALALGKPAHITSTVILPAADRLQPQPVVCFAKPGGGYSRHYFTHELPGPGQAAQGTFHAERGWIVVATDVLGPSESSPQDPADLTVARLTAAAHVAEQEILLRLANGVLVPGYPPVIQPARLGIGHATGASLTVIQQAHHGSYDGIAMLGCSGFHNHPPSPPGEPTIVTPWLARHGGLDGQGSVINVAALAHTEPPPSSGSEWSALTWAFYYDDVPAHVVRSDVGHYEVVAGDRSRPRHGIAAWHSTHAAEQVTSSIFTPGIIAAEAAATAVPVLSAVGERDLIVDLAGEARAFRSAPSFELFVCPRMGHMHNFAGTRALLWSKLHHFGEWVRAWTQQAGG